MAKDCCSLRAPDAMLFGFLVHGTVSNFQFPICNRA